MRNAVLNRGKEIAQLKNARNVHKIKIETLDKRIVELEKLKVQEQKEITTININELTEAFNKINEILKNFKGENK